MQLAHLKLDQKEEYRMERCFLTSKQNFSAYDEEGCMTPDDTKINILLIGDSHAAHYLPGLRQEFSNANILQANSSGCAPLYNYFSKDTQLCHKMNAYIFEQVIPNIEYDAVILARRWEAEEVIQLKSTINYIKKYNDEIYVFGPVPTYHLNVPEILVRLSKDGKSNPESTNFLIEPTREISMALTEANKTIGVNLYLPHNSMCPENHCFLTVPEDNIPVQFDSNHLSVEGSKWLVHQFKKTGLLEGYI